MIKCRSYIYMLFFSIILANVIVLPVHAVDVDALEAEIKVLEAEKSTLQTKLNKLNSEISSYNSEVELLEEENEKLTVVIADIVKDAFEHYESVQVKPLEVQNELDAVEFINRIVSIKSVATINNQKYSINEIFGEQKAILAEYWVQKKEAQEMQVSNTSEIKKIEESLATLESDKNSVSKEISSKNSVITSNYNKINASKYTEDTTTSESSGTGQEVVNYALKFIGTPYKLGGTSLTSGIDCSGFVRLVYAKFGYSLPNTTVYQINSGKAVSYSSAVAGDLIFYSGHVAMYIGSGKIVHASESSGVKVSSATYTTIKAVRRIIY